MIYIEMCGTDSHHLDQVAKVVEYLRAAAKREDRIATDNRGTRLGSCSAYAALALKQEADAIEHGEHLK